MGSVPGFKVPDTILRLVEQFDRNLDACRSSAYNEAQLRQDFLNPFFEAMGWDVANKQGFDQRYRQVIHEDALRVGGTTKAPDYSFRIGGARKFFVEAKKPSHDLKHDIGPAFQLRRYAWTAKLPLSILTDFEEFCVYETRTRPKKTDKPATGRISYIRFQEYPDKWEEITGIFSPKAIQQGSFDRFAEAKKDKRGTAEVDSEFLKDIEAWRDILARNIALRNPRLLTRQLNFAVQRTIDRIIFLRICEDRGIERAEGLHALLNGARIYRRLFELFYRADERYNSGLFHFSTEKGRAEPDEVTPKLKLDDKVLKDIIRSLYYPDSPYEFSVFPADILGHVYEQFLGKVIRLTAGHRAKVEYKPEVRKAGGVYYTPTYIVDYIVKNTVGKLLEGKPGPKPRPLTPAQASRLRILDPACGSGSFLLGAFQYLLDWHRDWYEKHGPDKHRKVLYQGPGGEWRLTTGEKKRILLNNIFGVDIDSQAVEVTKLSLLLKVLEGESDQTISLQQKMFRERALPDLANNIKCGNSLIGSDFYEGEQQTLFEDEEQRLRINVFDWEDEFPDIMKSGGFDAVIGNPPYVRQEALADFKDYMTHRYASYHSMADLYIYFFERGLSLLNPGGYFSMIVSRSFLHTAYAVAFRRHIASNYSLLSIVDFGGLPVFRDAKDTYVCIPLFSKRKQPSRTPVCKVASLDRLNLKSYAEEKSYSVPSGRFNEESWSLRSRAEQAVFEKVKSCGTPLKQYVDGRIFYGIKTGFNEAFIIDAATKAKMVTRATHCKALLRPFLGGQDIRRYHVRETGKHLIAIPSGWTRNQMRHKGRTTSSLSEREAWVWFRRNFPPLAKHLESFSGAAKRRQDQGEFWWELRPCDYYDILEAPKLIYPDIAKNPRFYYDPDSTYITNTAYCLGTDDLYLLGILNSRLAWFAISFISIPFGTRAGQYRYRLIYQYMEKLPIRTIDFSDKADKARHDKMVRLVERMLKLHKDLPKAKGASKTAIERRVKATDRQIDELVYELYRLPDKEIGIVEEMAT